MEPMELATAYSVFANNGQLKEFTPVLKIEDSYGNLIYNSQETENIGKQVISK
jgi:membrane peptidoglycan carboxypeptidase